MVHFKKTPPNHDTIISYAETLSPKETQVPPHFSLHIDSSSPGCLAHQCADCCTRSMMAMSSGGFVGALNIRVRQRSCGACWKTDSTVLSSTGRPREPTARAKDPQDPQGAVHMVKPRPWDQPLDLVAKVLEISCQYHVMIICHDDHDLWLS